MTRKLMLATRRQKEGNTHRPALPSTRRNPGRRDGVRWNGRSFLCPLDVDDGSPEIPDEDAGIYDDTVYPEHRAPVGAAVVYLLAIARPAKAKGIAKEFEIIDRVPRVIALDEGVNMHDDRDDEWETVDVREVPGAVQMSYSAVLKGNG